MHSELLPSDKEASERKKSNDYNLNLPRYIDSTEPEDIQDIDGHLRGGIPDRDIDGLDRYWQVMPKMRAVLFQPADRSGYSCLQPPIAAVNATIFDRAEFTAFKESVTLLFDRWQQTNTPRLKGFDKDGLPKVLIETIAEDLLATFESAPLLMLDGLMDNGLKLVVECSSRIDRLHIRAERNSYY